MMKRNWMITLLRILFIFCIGVPLYGKVVQNEQFLDTFTGLGYPIYFSYILGVAYILGLVSILQSKFPMLKEWAYAGFTFALLGAFLSHLLSSQLGMGVWALVTLIFLLSTYYIEKWELITAK